MRDDGDIVDLTASDGDDEAPRYTAPGYTAPYISAPGYTAYVHLTRAPIGPFFADVMRSQLCSICRTTHTFMFVDNERTPMCNTCFGRAHGAVVLPSSTHGYGVFAHRRASDGHYSGLVFPEPHVDEAFPVERHWTEPRSLVFAAEQTLMYMGGELFTESDHGAVFGKCGTPYAVSAGDEQVLDATLYRTPACYINSVRNEDTQGANVKLWYDDTTGEVSITALRDIYAGEELFLDYGPAYAWDIQCTVTVLRDGPQGPVAKRARTRAK